MRNIMIFSSLFFAASSLYAQTDRQVIENISQHVIVQTYVDLASKTAELEKAVNIFTSTPTASNLLQAQNAWKSARIPWESSEAFLFGPVDALGIDPLLDTWPLNRLDLEAVMKSNRRVDKDFVRVLGTNVQGFHTLEYLLFGDGVNTNSKEISQFNSRQFEYLNATASLLAEHAKELAYSWTHNFDPEDSAAPGYVQIISKPGLNNPFYSSDRAVIEEFVQGVIGILDEVGNGKIADPFGNDINSADVSLVESPYSWNSLSDFTNNVQSVYNMYTGSYLDHKGPGIKSLVSRRNPQLAAAIEIEIVNVQKLIQEIGQGGMPFRRAIKDPQGRARIQKAVDAISDLRNRFESEVLPLLG